MTTPAVKIAALAGITRSANDNYGIGVEQPGNKLTIAGMIHTTAGGIKFPDGTIQTTAGAGAIDIPKLLTDLTGKITQTQLYTDLGTKIDRINTISTDLTAVQQGLIAEALARGAAITNEQTIRQTEISSLASNVTTLTAAVGTNAAAIQTERTTRADAISALATQVTNIVASVDSTAVSAAISAEQTARATADTALATSITTLTANVNDNAAAIRTEQTTRADAISALATQVTNLVANVDSTAVSAAIQTESTARATADTALATSITTLEATVAGNTAAITTESTARATATGDLFAQYTVKTDVAGLISGFGLASEAKVNEAPTSAFGIRADKFWIAPPAHASATAPTTGLYEGYTWLDTSVTPNVTKYRKGTTWSTIPATLPFVVTTGDSTINGVTVPAGVYMNTAMIADATITSAKIGTLTADKIDTRGLTIKDAAGNVVLSAGAFAIPGTVTNVPAGWLNSNLTASIEAAQLTATNAANSISGKLDKAGSQILTGPVQLNAANAIYVGTADNGLYLGSTGIVGRKNGANTFAVGADGTATFSGNIAGASLDIGSSPAISGTKMTGSGAHIESNGKFALGTASKSIVYNGDDFYLNGRMVNTSNFSLSTPISVGSSMQVAGPVEMATGGDTQMGIASQPKRATDAAPTARMIGYAILPWTGFSSLTVDYDFTIIPPYTSSTKPSNYTFRSGIGSPSYYGAMSQVVITVQMIADGYSSLADFNARNNNFIPIAIMSKEYYVSPITGVDISSYFHGFGSYAGVFLGDEFTSNSKKGSFTLQAGSNWYNFFSASLTTAQVESALDGSFDFSTQFSGGISTDYPTAWSTGLSAFSAHATNFRFLVTMKAASAWSYWASSSGAYVAGTMANVSMGLTGI